MIVLKCHNVSSRSYFVWSRGLMKILGGATSARSRHFTLLVCHVRLSTASVSHSSTVMYSCNALFSILITTLFSFIHLDFRPRLCLYHNILCSCSLKLLYHGLTAGASARCSNSLSMFHSSFQYCSSQPSMVHWLSSPIFPFVCPSRYGNILPNLHFYFP